MWGGLDTHGEFKAQAKRITGMKPPVGSAG